RIKVEKAKVQAVIDKAERTDVVNNEEKYLTNMERDVLREWRNTEEKLLVQLARQDDLVALFRDFTPEMPAS
ncbi:RNA polymerase III subunit C82, partial [Cryomyces antarcticus]